VLGREEVKRAGRRETYDRYKYLRNRAERSAHPDWRFCLSPDCSSGQMHPAKEGPKMVCKACGFKTCVKHEAPWHSRQTCEEHDRAKSSKRKAQEDASEKWKAKEAKKCANCGVPILKNGGCNEMWCTQCNQGFDWRSAENYKKDKKEKEKEKEKQPPKEKDMAKKKGIFGF